MWVKLLGRPAIRRRASVRGPQPTTTIVAADATIS
jgi:hypothetical protein